MKKILKNYGFIIFMLVGIVAGCIVGALWPAVKDAEGNIIAVHCTYDPASKGGNSPDGRKVKGTIHWVAAETAVPADIRLYENLIDEEKADEKGSIYDENGELYLNPHSLEIRQGYLEPAFAGAQAYERFQFVRQGFFCVDAKDSAPEHLVFNRIVSLKSSFVLPK